MAGAIPNLTLRIPSCFLNPKLIPLTSSPSSTQIGAVTRGLQDKHPYPRKTAAMGVLKIHDLDREALLETEILQTVRAMVLTDQNAATVANCVATYVFPMYHIPPP
jgi:hypothetical protein